MYYNLVAALKRRLVLELQDSFARHPIYNKIVPNIQNRYAFASRPQYGIVIKGSSANKVQLSADNFLGTVMSRVMLAMVGEPSHPIEWAREDLQAIYDNGGTMPTPPGVYYIEIQTVPTAAQKEGTFAVDPLYTQYDEPLLHFESGIEREAQLQRVPVRGTVRLWVNNSYALMEGEDYEVNYDTGAIRFKIALRPHSKVAADYRYAGESIEGIPFQWNTSDRTTLPGVVLAFGKRARVEDKVAVVIYPDRTEVARAYGGRFDVNFDMDVLVAGDAMQTEEIADLAVMYLWNDKRSKLSSEGIEIMDVTLGGEAEESYDENADIFYYTASISVQMQSDWEVHVPLPLAISGHSLVLEQVNSDLYYATHPIVVGRNHEFETIV